MQRTVSGRAVSLAAGAGLVLAATGGIATAAGPVGGADSATAVDGRYIVVLDEETTATADDLATRYGGTVNGVYRHALSGFSVSLDESGARRLAADPAVTSVEAVHRIDVDNTTAAPGHKGLDRIDQRDLPLDGEYRHPDSAGAGVTTYVIDTGVRFSHQEFGGRATSGPDFVDGDDDASDCLGNGTALAGVAAGETYGVAKESAIVGVRVLDCQGSGTTDGVLGAIDWVAGDAGGRPAVAVIGFGGGVDNAMDTAITRAVEAGVNFALPAGGSDADACQFSPGRVPDALTAGGTVTTTDARLPRSNTGRCLDLFAPATDITTATHTGDTDTTGFAGTAAAAAHVAGAAALYLAEHPDADPGAVTAALTANATPGKVTDPGPDSPNLLLYTGFLNPATG